MVAILLNIPFELRNEVYLYLLTPPTGTYSISKINKLPNQNPLDILLTCRQIHNEAKNIYFERNIWVVADDEDLHAFQLIQKKRFLRNRLCNSVRHISIELQISWDFNFMDLMTAFQLLSKWAKKTGALRTITVTLRPEDTLINLSSEESRISRINERLAFNEIMEFLDNSRALGRAERTLVLDSTFLGYLRLSYTDGTKIPFEQRKTLGRYIENELPAEVWVRGIPCYDYNEEVPFRRKSHGDYQTCWAPKSEFH